MGMDAETAFAPNAKAILADIPNYTNTQPPFRSARSRCDALEKGDISVAAVVS
jgi:hypothetical protein